MKSSVAKLENLGNLLEEGAFSARERCCSARVILAKLVWEVTEVWRDLMDEVRWVMRDEFCWIIVDCCARMVEIAGSTVGLWGWDDKDGGGVALEAARLREVWDWGTEDNDGGCGSRGGVGGWVESRCSRAAMRRVNSCRS